MATPAHLSRFSCEFIGRWNRRRGTSCPRSGMGRTAALLVRIVPIAQSGRHILLELQAHVPVETLKSNGFPDLGNGGVERPFHVRGCGTRAGWRHATSNAARASSAGTALVTREPRCPRSGLPGDGWRACVLPRPPSSPTKLTTDAEPRSSLKAHPRPAIGGLDLGIMAGRKWTPSLLSTRSGAEDRCIGRADDAV
jgi:hypothetical protein